MFSGYAGRDLDNDGQTVLLKRPFPKTRTSLRQSFEHRQYKTYLICLAPTNLPILNVRYTGTYCFLLKLLNIALIPISLVKSLENLTETVILIRKSRNVLIFCFVATCVSFVCARICFHVAPVEVLEFIHHDYVSARCDCQGQLPGNISARVHLRMQPMHVMHTLHSFCRVAKQQSYDCIHTNYNKIPH